MKCGAKHCEEEASWFYVWPGSPPLYACEHHGQQAQGLARFMGFELMMVPAECAPLVVGPQEGPKVPAIEPNAQNPERSEIEPDRVRWCREAGIPCADPDCANCTVNNER